MGERRRSRCLPASLLHGANTDCASTGFSEELDVIYHHNVIVETSHQLLEVDPPAVNLANAGELFGRAQPERNM
jgi:hypothetical protein